MGAKSLPAQMTIVAMPAVMVATIAKVPVVFAAPVSSVTHSALKIKNENTSDMNAALMLNKHVLHEQCYSILLLIKWLIELIMIVFGQYLDIGRLFIRSRSLFFFF